jgi:hypothetical protein
MEDKPMAPNFYFEAKGPDGSATVTRRQACYNGAMEARGMQSLQSYRQNELVYNNHAYTITSTYHDRQLKMYTTYITLPAGPGKLPEYHMTQLNTWGLTGNADTFRQGATVFWNGRDLTKKWHDGFISAVNERVGLLNTELSTLRSSNYTLDTTDSYPTSAEESEVSADELALTLYLIEEPKTSVDEPALTSFSYPVDVSFLLSVEDDISADELDHITYMKPIVSKKCPGTGSKKTVSKNLCYGTGTSSQRRQSQK